MGILARFKPPGYVTAVLLVSLAGFLNGYDTGSIGAVTVMPLFESSIGAFSPFMRGFTVSLVMLCGGVPAVFAGQMADKFGHLKVVGSGAVVLGVGALLEGAALELPMFLVGRAFAGLGQGIALSNSYVYCCEISPSARRGVLVNMPQLGTTLAICLGYFTCYGSVHIDSSFSWRLPFVVQVILALILAISCWFLPDSPRWLVVHDRGDDAVRAVERLGILNAEAEKDIFRAPRAEEVEAEKTTMLEGLVIIFRTPYRVRTLLALFMLGSLQLSGIDGILYYAPLLFQQAGFPEATAGFLASGLSAILMFLITIPAVTFADKWGRRTSIIVGGLVLAGSMLSIGALYASGVVHAYGVARWFIVIFIFVFALAYCASWAVCGKLYASEILPSKTRAYANCVAQGLGFFTNWLVAFATPIFLGRSSSGPYFLYGATCLFTVTVLALYMPETRGEPLESIEEKFSKPILQSWAVTAKKLISRSLQVAPRVAVYGFEGSATRSTSVSDPSSIELIEFPVKPIIVV